MWREVAIKILKVEADCNNVLEVEAGCFNILGGGPDCNIILGVYRQVAIIF